MVNRQRNKNKETNISEIIQNQKSGAFVDQSRDTLTKYFIFLLP